jgi:hypothetical protein
MSVQSFNLRPLAFTQNNGQWDERVLYRADAGGALMWFTTEGVYYQFTRHIPSPLTPLPLGEGNGERAAVGRNPLDFDTFGAPPSESVILVKTGIHPSETDSIETLIIKATFVSANPNPVMRGDDLMEYKCNYFLGNDPSKWRTDVPNYKAVVFEDIYAGIDLKYYGNGDGKMEYDFLVSPGADFSQIMVQYDGAKSVSVNESGELVVETGWGDMIERRPIVYQIEPSVIRPIEGEYVLLGEDRFGFELDESYEPIYATVIDPVLAYSTYLGGSDLDVGYDIAVDGNGSAYVGGYTRSPNFPIQNPFDGSFNGGDYDAFVTKFSPTGNSLIYSTYVGGYLDDACSGIAVDELGCAYVVGYTYSSNFPTQNAYDLVFNGGDYDGFVTKLAAAGSILEFSTFLGGSNNETSWDVAVDLSASVYVSGTTASADFPTLSAYDASHNGSRDAFLVKLSHTGNSLLYSTFLGGSGYEEGFRVTVDDLGCAFVVGGTENSPNFPTINAYDSIPGGGEDAFVAKLSSAGSEMLYCTLLGGAGGDEARGIAVDDSGCAYVTGETSSSDFPTLNAFDSTHAGSYGDVFVTKISPSGNSLVYSTFLGSTGEDRGYNLAIDDSLCAYVTGRTYSSLFPTRCAIDATYDGNGDAFVTKVAETGNALVYSTFLGSTPDDDGRGIAIDDLGCAYVTGWTFSTEFPTNNAFDPTHNGGLDGFVTKLSAFVDNDRDCVSDDIDNCPSVSNGLQEDFDQDESGDSCDVCTDTDGDGYGDPGFPANTCEGDNCPSVYNPDQADCDFDEIGDACEEFICGDANGSGGDPAVDIDDVVFLINYVFAGGAAPCPPQAGDANCSGGDVPIDIDDIVYLINYIFAGGPAPCDPDGDTIPNC